MLKSLNMRIWDLNLEVWSPAGNLQQTWDLFSMGKGSTSVDY